MKEVVNSYALDCAGAQNTLKDKVAASITVFDNGDREVGCPLVSLAGSCTVVNDENAKSKAESSLNSQCVHLFPAKSSVEAN